MPKAALKSKVSRQYHWGETQKKKGRCCRCGKKRTSRSAWNCDDCLKKNNNRRKLVRQRKKLKQLQKSVSKLEGGKK